MNSTLKLNTESPEIKLEEVRQLLALSWSILERLSGQFTDNKGNLAEAAELVYGALVNVKAQQFDISEGRE